MRLSKSFVDTITSTFGTPGRRWLDELPGLLRETEERWSLQIDPPLPSLSYNYVAPARRMDGSWIAVKLGVPNRELLTEIEALRLYAGRGAVHLLAEDPERGILLLEYCSPGTTLAALESDEAATAVAVEAMRRLWRPLPAQHSFPTTANWASGLDRLRQRFQGTSGPLPENWVDLAEGLFSQLLGSSAEPVLLHGDLHHENILAAQRQPWLVIDPKGVAGEPAYEVGALLRNPIPDLLRWPNRKAILARRIDQLVETLGFERERVLGWGVAQAVLAACWTIEDGSDNGSMWIACAELLASLS
jgi:streptomycin 6-kinase